MKKGREDEALLVLAKLHARGNTDHVLVRGEFEQMRQATRHESNTDQGWSQITKSRHNLRKVLLGVILQFSVQMTGVSAIQYYSPRVFAAVGFSQDTTFLIASINNVVGLIGEALCIAFLDMTGRRLPMILGNCTAGACFAIAA